MPGNRLLRKRAASVTWRWHRPRADSDAVVAPLLDRDATQLIEELCAIAQTQNGRAGTAQHAVGAGQTLQPQLLLASLRLERGLTQGALHGRSQAGKICLQDIVGRPPAQRLDGALLADGAGDENERGIRRQRDGDFKGAQPVELRQ